MGKEPARAGAEPPPELQRILAQVEVEVIAMIARGETGTVTVHVGDTQVQLECNARRKQQPVRVNAAYIAMIKRIR